MYNWVAANLQTLCIVVKEVFHGGHVAFFGGRHFLCGASLHPGV